MRLNIAVPEEHVSKDVLDAALEGVTRLDESLISSGAVPTFERVSHRVRWEPEPPGAEHFDHAQKVMARGHGDCDDLGPWHAASLRVTGEDRGARAIVQRSGPKRWHVVVRRSDGSIDDPSVEAGMLEHPASRADGVVCAGLPSMYRAGAAVSGPVGSYIARPQLALRPVHDRDGQVEAWQSRVDLPWHSHPGKSPTDIAMAALHASPTAAQSAVVGALEGAIDFAGCSGYVHPETINRAAAVRDGILGAHQAELEREYGPQHAMAAAQIVGAYAAVFGRRHHHHHHHHRHHRHHHHRHHHHHHRHRFGRWLKHAAKHAGHWITHKALPAVVHVAEKLAPALNVVPGLGTIAAPLASVALKAADKALHHKRIHLGDLAAAAGSSLMHIPPHPDHLMHFHVNRALKALKLAHKHGHPAVRHVHPNAIADLRRFAMAARKAGFAAIEA